jgi:hypothetical protein
MLAPNKLFVAYFPIMPLNCGNGTEIGHENGGGHALCAHPPPFEVDQLA